MDTDFLYSSYRRYKANTDAVATWLLTTAREHGCRAYDSNDSSPAPSAATPRLKGKARKLAREADAAAEKQARSRPTAYRIEIKDFIQLAQYIANSTKPRIKVPDYTVRDLQQEIKMRKSHQAWLAMLPSRMETDSASTAHAHTHFIKTLEIVYEVLRPNMPETSRTTPVRNAAVVKECQMTNIFENLTVEEPLEVDDTCLETQRPDAVENISVTVSDSENWEMTEAWVALSLPHARLAQVPRGHSGGLDFLPAGPNRLDGGGNHDKHCDRVLSEA
jgi:hypothetical protein